MRKLQADVGIIAAGPAGLAAAITVAERGGTAVVFEKAPIVGGTANMGMGPFGVESRIQKRFMITLTKEEAFKKFMDYTHWAVDARLVRNYFWKSGETIDWLEDMGVVFEGPQKYHGDSEYTWHVVQPDGGGKAGPRAASAMTRVMHERAVEMGVEFLLETPAKKILKQDGKVCGILAEDKNGEEVQLDCGAVIIATGGFGDNPEMIRAEVGYEWGKDLFSMRSPGVSGDGLRMAWEAGAARAHMEMERIMGCPLPDSSGLKVPFNQPNLMVNAQGERFCDEGISINGAVCANAVHRQPGHMAYMILTDTIVKHYRRNGMDFASGVQSGDFTRDFDARAMAAEAEVPQYLKCADSLEELAEKLGVPADTFLQTVADYNEACDQNFDDLFCKERRYLRPIRGKRFYAAARFPGAYGSLGGIRVNHRLEVEDEDFRRIDGLYAAGSDVCDLYAGTYLYDLPGNTMGFAVNSGRMAAENATDYVFDGM